jgi:molybdate transport system regulatory protein
MENDGRRYSKAASLDFQIYFTGMGHTQGGAAQPRPRKITARTVARGTVPGMARLRVSIVLASGARIGPGKAKLLESIRDTGSISAAAREMGMSYKRAWLLLDSMNQAFTELVVTAAPGGAGGGGATLTAFGAEVLERYNRILDHAATTVADDLTALARRARPEAGPKV